MWMAEGDFVDLWQNPERFTGYAGDSAQRVWRAIYEQNCFPFVYGQSGPLLRQSIEDEAMCIERRIFYRLISGALIRLLEVYLNYRPAFVHLDPCV